MEIKMDFNETYKVVLQNSPEVLSVKEASNVLRVSTKTVYKLIKNGSIQNMKVGRSYRIPKIHLLSFLRIYKKNV